LAIVLQTNQTQETPNGIRKGWTTWTGDRAKALSMCLFSTNINDNTARNSELVPFIGLEGLSLVHRCDTGNDDNAVTYAARIRTKPYILRTLLQAFGVKSAVLLAKAVTGSKITMKLIRDFGLETVKTTASISLAATASETDVIQVLDDFSGSELRVAEIEFNDTTPTAGTRFELNQLFLLESTQQKN
jgi:hypothetical protein